MIFVGNNILKGIQLVSQRDTSFNWADSDPYCIKQDPTFPPSAVAVQLWWVMICYAQFLRAELNETKTKWKVCGENLAHKQ